MITILTRNWKLSLKPMGFRSGDLQLQEASLLSQLYFSPWEKTLALFLKLNFQAKNVSGIFAGNSPAKKNDHGLFYYN